MRRGSVGYRFVDHYLGIPALRTVAIFNRRRQMPSDIHSVGFLVSPTVGDALLTSAAVLDIRKAFPTAHLIYFAAAGARAAAQLIPAIDTIVPIDVTKPLFTVRTMRRCDLDVLIDFTQWQRITALFCGLSGAGYRVGFNSKAQSRHWLYDVTVAHSDKMHEIENFRALVRQLGISNISQPELLVPFGQDPMGVSPVVFHPWASGQRSSLREWDTKNWVELASRLAHGDTSFVVTGTQLELPRSDHLARELQRAGLRAAPFVGHDGLVGISQLIKACELVVSVNTGIMHLAALLGAPTVALNGPTASHRWGPVGARTYSVEPRGGGGFLHFGFEFAGHSTDTMDRIHVDDVFAAAQSLRFAFRQAAASV
jgi:heptosyltransferase-3